MWKVKNKEIPEELPSLPEEPEDEEALIKERLKELERKKIEKARPNQEFNKFEIIDAIQGNLARISQMIELLRR